MVALELLVEFRIIFTKMSIYFVREEGIPLEQRRGIETIDRNLVFVLVRASVERVAQAFSTLKQMNVWVRNAYECEIEIQNESTFVFQLRGHPWSLIYKLYRSSIRIYLTEEDARKLSGFMNTSVIYYAGSDTSGTIEYHLYTNGILQEKLYFEENFKCEFQSQLRQVEVRNIKKDPYTFTMNFIREQEAYIPCVVEVKKLLVGQHTTLRIEDLMLNEVERMDYLAQQ
ncbi:MULTISPECIES: hypothetical protein [Nostoc]|uniref:Uncharacterized protein n=1 Tax=Nostoc paludosum FACHB-159 TaxID=2692908 RepID=A0ABR8K0S5_9NOSO|nr:MULTISPECIES: hypothetical protein [Nostoc]MBD2677158.1 hypothetical protein [Nostoc sp. FACHB-857]MBD2733033.1 hypothetical protein [Nostoc paludosum FACHB-159]